jgi:hypothetical protein
MLTYTEVMRDVEIPAHLEADAEVPVVSGAQRQGDVICLPMRPGNVANLKPIPAEGIIVVRGEAGGNTHRLMADGPCFWAPSQTRDATQGSLVVEDGGTAYLIHEEHGAQGIAPGHYTLRRQQEQAEIARLVAD